MPVNAARPPSRRLRGRWVAVAVAVALTAVALVATAGPASAAPPTTPALTVGSWNTALRPWLADRQQAVNDVIVGTKLDVLALQGVWTQAAADAITQDPRIAARYRFSYYAPAGPYQFGYCPLDLPRGVLEDFVNGVTVAGVDPREALQPRTGGDLLSYAGLQGAAQIAARGDQLCVPTIISLLQDLPAGENPLDVIDQAYFTGGWGIAQHASPGLLVLSTRPLEGVTPVYHPSYLEQAATVYATVAGSRIAFAAWPRNIYEDVVVNGGFLYPSTAQQQPQLAQAVLDTGADLLVGEVNSGPGYQQAAYDLLASHGLRPLISGPTRCPAATHAGSTLCANDGLYGPPSDIAVDNVFTSDPNPAHCFGATTFATTPVSDHVGVQVTCGQVAPGSPTGVQAVPGDRSAVVSWTPPSFDGNSPVTGYTVTATPPAGSTQAPVTTTVGTAATTASLTGLTGGVAYTVSVAAVNAVGTGQPATTTVTPNATPTISGSAPNTTVGTAYSFSYTASGYPAPTFAVASGSLPNGLALSSDGKLTGTATAAGTSTFTVAASNTAGTVTSAAQHVTVAPAAASAITISGGNGQAGTAGQPFAAPLAVTVTDAYGNPVPGRSVTFTVTSGAASFGAAATATATTDAAGVAKAPTLTAGRTAGTVTVTAALTGDASVAAATFSETVLTVTSARADLKVTITGVPASTARGGSFTATVTVTNSGPNAAGALLAGVNLGPNLRITASSGGGQLAAGQGSVAWKANGLAAGSSLTYTVTATSKAVKSAYTSQVQAAVISVVPDPRPADNVAEVRVRLT